jgi:hypothetical protein
MQCSRRPRPLSLSDRQLDTVARAAGALPVEKRDVYLRRIAAALALRGPAFTDDDLAVVIEHARSG